MKKFLVFLIASLMVFVVAACGSNGSTSGEGEKMTRNRSQKN